MTKIKRISLFIFIICLVLVTGCKNNVDVVNTSNKQGDTADDPYQNINVKGSGKLECSREGNAINGLTADFKYFVTYDKGIMKVLHSIEKVSGDDKDSLDQYEDAYNKIKDNYKDIKYYDINVIREDDSVSIDMNINYEKVDVKKVIEMESDTIYDDDNRPILKKWLERGKKAGLTCKGTTD